MQLDSARLEMLTRTLRGDRRIAAAWVFGSGAVGTLRADSDIDIAIRTDPAAAVDVFGLGAELGLELGPIVQVIDLRAAPLALRMQVFRYGRLLFDRAPSDTARLLEGTLTRWFDEAPLRRLVRESARHHLDDRRAS